MPAFPSDNIKVVMRPRGESNGAKLTALVHAVKKVTTLVHAAAGTAKAAENEDICAYTRCRTRAAMEIIVICTAEERSSCYSQIKEIAVRGKKHEVWAYRTPGTSWSRETSEESQKTKLRTNRMKGLSSDATRRR